MSGIPDEFWQRSSHDEQPIVNKISNKLSNVESSNKPNSKNNNNDKIQYEITHDVNDSDQDPLYVPKNTAGTILITKSGAFIKFDDLVPKSHTYAFVKKIANYFTLKHMAINGSFITRKRCIVDVKNRRIIVPRFGVIFLFEDILSFLPIKVND
jgi:hypothetical protein